MRKFTFFLLAALIACVPMYAQKKDKGGDRKMELQEYRMKVLAQEMELKEDQQKKFFELYGQMTEEKIKLFKEKRALEKKLEDSEDISDAEYKKVSEAITLSKEKMAQIERKYDEKFSQFLTQKQIYKMKVAEEKFRQKMNEVRHKKKSSKK